MKFHSLLPIITSTLTLGACALPPASPYASLLGASPETVAARLGMPPETRQLGDGRIRWFYPTRPLGQVTWRAEFDRAGALVSYRQALTSGEFAQARVGAWTKADVLDTFGEPLPEKTYFPRMRREAWSYRYVQDGAWPALMHLLFDDAGILQGMQVENPDPLHDPELRRRIFR